MKKTLFTVFCVIGLLMPCDSDALDLDGSSGCRKPDCSFVNYHESYTKFANKYDAFPLVAAAALSLFHADFDGLIRLTAIQLVKSPLKPKLKRMINRNRPCGCGGGFPSGHVMLATQGASYLHYRYGLKYGMPAYAFTGLIGYARTRTKSHDWFDVLGSFALMNLVTYLVVPPYKPEPKRDGEETAASRKRRKKQESQPFILPYVDIKTKTYMLSLKIPLGG